MREKNKKHIYVFKRNASLKKEVYKQLKATDVGIYKEIRRNKSPWWAPSKHNLFIFSIFALIIGLISHIHELGICPVSVNTYINTYLVAKPNDYLIAICIGIGAVLVGFAFFIAQSFLDKEDPDRGRVLLYTSKFYVLLSSEIVILLICVCGEPNILTNILIGILGVFTIWSLYRTVQVLLYVNEMEKARLELFKGIIRRFILHELCRRISYQELFRANEELQKRYSGISLSPFDKVNNGVKIKAINSGTVTDIKLGRFERLFLKAEKKEKAKGANEQIILNMRILPYSHISDSNTLIEMKKESFSNLLLKKNREKQIRSVFAIKKADYEEKTEIEISKLKQRCLLLIEQERDDELEKTLSTFKEVTNLFIDIFDKENWNFKKEQAERQRGAFLGDRIKLLDWILSSFRMIFYKAINSDNINIIRIAAHLPISLSISAIKSNDHLIFQNFIRYPVLMYIEGCKRKEINIEAFEFIIERSWRYLNELSDFYLKYPYEEGGIEDQDFLDYSFYIFKAFQDLLIKSYDKRDIESFRIYLSKHMSLYKHLNDDTIDIKPGKSTYDKIKEYKNQVIFGLGSWITNRHLDNKEDINKIYLNEISQVWKPDIKYLTELFIDMYKDNDKWGWVDLELESKEEGEAHFLNISRELENYYIVMCLKTLQSEPSINNVQLPCCSEFVFLAGELIQIVNSIKEDPGKWDVLSENQRLKCDDLIRLLEKAKKQQEEKEAKFVRGTPIFIDKVIAFKEGVLKSMQTKQGIKNILEHYKAIIWKEELSEMSDKFGINMFFGKEWFIDSEKLNTIWVVGLDEHIGESMINGENLNILQKLQAEAQEISPESFEDYLNSQEDLREVVIIAVNYQPYDFFENKYKSDTYIANWYPNFSDKWLKEFPDGLEGVLKYKQHRIPVYEYFIDLPYQGLLIVDFKKIKASQYPLDLKSEEQYITIDVQEFKPGSVEENEVISNAPEWLKEIGNKEAQRQYIEERVIVKVFEQFDLTIEKDAIARISLT